jgi:hypothetical protein
LDVLGTNGPDGGNSKLLVKNLSPKCSITTDGSKGAFTLSFGDQRYIILVDLNSQTTKCIRRSKKISKKGPFSVGKSYCIGVNNVGDDLIVEELSNGEVVAEWMRSSNLDFTPIVALSKNDLVAVIAAHGGRVHFLKIIVPD